MHMLVSRWHFVKKVLCIDNSMSPWNGGSIRHFPHGDSQRGVVAPLPVRFLWTSAVNLARLWRAFVEKDFTHLADVCQTVLFFTDVLVTSLCPVILENSYIPAQWSVVTYKLLVHTYVVVQANQSPTTTYSNNTTWVLCTFFFVSSVFVVLNISIDVLVSIMLVLVLSEAASSHIIIIDLNIWNNCGARTQLLITFLDSESKKKLPIWIST